MAAGDCIRARAKEGELAESKAREIGELADNLEKQMMAQGAHPLDAETRAQSIAQSAWENGLRAKKTIRLRQTAAQATILDYLRSVPTKQRDAAAKALLTPDFRGRFTPLNLERLIQQHTGAAHSIMTDFLGKARSTHAGFVQDKALSEDVVRELIDGFGTSGNRSAKEVGGGVEEMFEYFRQQLVRMGLPIARVKGYVPQTHNMLEVREIGQDEWKGFITPLLNRERMIDRETSLPFTDEKLDRVLDKTWRNIAFGGMDTIKPGKPRVESVLQKLDRERFLLFRNADAYLTYARRFGSDNYWNTITGYVSNMARDVARVQILGPQPTSTVRAINDELLRAAKEIDPRAQLPLGEGKAGASFTQLYDDTVGSTQSIGAERTLAKTGDIIRSVVLSATLGSAYFSAVTDFAFANVAARMTGLPYLRVIRRMGQTFLPGTPLAAKQAIRAGLTAQGWVSQAIAAQRVSGEVITTEWARRMTDTVLRLGLLSPHTDALRWSYGTELMGFVTDNIGRSFDELDEPLRRGFQRAGMTPDEWDAIRKAPTFKDPESGAEWLRPMEVARQPGGEAAASRYFMFVQNEIDAAVPTSNARTRAALRRGTQKGTVLGELVRFAGLLKQFPVSIMAVQFARIASVRGGSNRALYVAHLVMASTMMAALGETMNQVSRGRMPEDFASPEFIQQAMFRAGAAGLAGDFLFTDINNQYRLSNFVLGPAIGGTVFDFIQLTGGNLQQAIRDEDTDFGRESVRFVKDNLPGGRLWFTRLAFERLLFDEVQRLVDPNAEESFRRQREFTRDKLGSKFFVRPGRGIKDIFGQ